MITPIWPKARKLVVGRDDVRSLRETPHGLVLDAPLARGRAVLVVLVRARARA